MASITTRRRATGTIELRVVHSELPRPFYATLDDEQEARSYAKRLVAALDRGDVPPELREAPVARRTPIARVLSQYLEHAPVAATDREQVTTLQNTIVVTVEGITIRWVDDWIRSMKAARLAPGTIRKKVECLARVVDWWNRREHAADTLPANPLRLLERGYSAYSDKDGEPVLDVARDRRLAPGEDERIVQVIGGWKRPDRQRPLEIKHPAALLLLYRLIVSTGLRLREAYSLQTINVKYRLKTIHVLKSKTGRARDIPMTQQVHDWLKAYSAPESGLLFPFWSGEPDDLRRASGRLSTQFSRIFEYAGIDDLTEHDLRHEATCRWMLMKDSQGRWMFRPEEVRRITGHKSVQVFERYLSLRGSDLAERLWEDS